jgi:hypothetical protein
MFMTFGDPTALEILFGGGAGGAKSYGVWSLAIMKCLEYDGITVGLARQTLAQIKRNSIASFKEVIRDFKIDESLYFYNEQKGEIKFFNGSMIQFFELRFLPSDPDYDRFGGALLTFGIVEEGAGCDNRGKEIFSSRLGRWRNKEYNIPPHLYITTNPGTNFVYSDFYIPATKGELASHRRYIPARVSDNTYLDSSYAEALFLRLGAVAAKRLLDGAWDFDGDDTRLCTYAEVNNIYEDVYVDDTATSYLTADIAFTSDRCIIVHWKGLVVKNIHIYAKKTADFEPEVEIEKLAKIYGVKPENIAYDADGVGKYLKAKLPRAYDIINNSVALYNENYDNLKTQLYYKLAEYVCKGKIKVADTTSRDSVVQEIYEIRSLPLEDVNGKMKIVPKKDIKKMIGRSPDLSDAIAFRMVWEIKRRIVQPFASKNRGRQK